MAATLQTTFFKGIFLNENMWIRLKFHYVPNISSNNNPEPVQIMARYKIGDGPWSDLVERGIYASLGIDEGTRPGVEVTKPISSVPLFSYYFNIARIHDSYWIARSYLTGVELEPVTLYRRRYIVTSFLVGWANTHKTLPILDGTSIDQSHRCGRR